MNKTGVIRVRPYPKDASLADLQRALSVVRANAKKWKVAKGYVGVMGYSAGGHLATRGGAGSESRQWSTFRPTPRTTRPSSLKMGMNKTRGDCPQIMQMRIN